MPSNHQHSAIRVATTLGYKNPVQTRYIDGPLTPRQSQDRVFVTDGLAVGRCLLTIDSD